MQTYKQGDFCNLCGIFSIVNSVVHLCNPKPPKPKHLFNALIKSSRDVTSISTQGSYVRDMRGWLNKTVEWAKECEVGEIKWNLPFWKVKHAEPSEWTSDLAHHLVGNSCAIIGITYPYNHWTVIHSITEEDIFFLDSNQLTQIKRQDIYFKKPKQSGNHLVVCQHQVFLLKGL
jgi:hypothetical protein